MACVTDDERRRVAERLRDKKAECEERGYPWMCDDLVLALGYDHDYEAGDEIFDRLADLIEPDTTTDTTNSPDLTTKCDRDALLALADEMGHPIKQSVWNQTAGVRRGHIMAEYARRIREACGEVES